MTRRSLNTIVLALLAGQAAALSIETVSGMAWMPAQVMKGVAGLAILHSVPGLYVAAFLIGRRRIGLGAFGLATVGLNFVCVILVSTVIKLCGFVVTPWTFWVGVALASLGLAILTAVRECDVEVTLPRPDRKWAAALACAAITLYVLTAHRPIPLSEDDFLTPDYQWRLAQIEPQAPLPASMYQVFVGRNAWYIFDGKGLRPGDTLKGDLSRTDRLRWLARTTGECLLTLKQGDEVLSAHYFHPPFDIATHPRNYPPNTQLIDVVVPDRDKGRHFTAELRAVHPDCRISYDDLTGLPKEEILRRVRSRYAIWDIGDVREQFSLARNLRNHLLPYAYSYDGTVFDGGGYTITHLPLRSYVGMAALVLMGDRMTSFLVVWIGQLCIIFLIVHGLVCMGGRGRDGLGLVCALLSVLAYATLIRPNIEGACLRTTSVITVLGMAYWLLWRSHGAGTPSREALPGFQKRGSASLQNCSADVESSVPRPLWPAVLFGCLCCLTKVGLMALPALLFFHAVLTQSIGKRVRAGLALVGGSLIGIALVAMAVGKIAGVWDAWWTTFLSASFLGKFSIALTALTDVPPSGDFVRLGAHPWLSFLAAIGDFTWWALLGSCFLPLAIFVRRDRPAMVLLLTGLFCYAVVVVSDPSLIIPNTYCSHYFTRVAGVVNLLAVSGLRCLALAPRRRWHVLWLALGIAALPLAARAHWRQDRALEQYPWHGAMYRASVIDFLKRRALDHISNRRATEARDDCYKMRLVDKTYLPTAILWAKCDQLEGKWPSAAEHYEIALSRPAELDTAREYLGGCLNAAYCYTQLGKSDRATHWLTKATGAEGFAESGLAPEAEMVRRVIDAMPERRR